MLLLQELKNLKNYTIKESLNEICKKSWNFANMLASLNTKFQIFYLSNLMSAKTRYRYNIGLTSLKKENF